MEQYANYFDYFILFMIIIIVITSAINLILNFKNKRLEAKIEEKSKSMKITKMEVDPSKKNILNEKFRDVSWLVNEMQLMRTDYINCTKEQPKGWIMGFYEYTRIQDAVKSQLKAEDALKFGDLEHFQGLPITIKCSRGVELNMKISAAALYFKNNPELKITREENLV